MDALFKISTFCDPSFLRQARTCARVEEQEGDREDHGVDTHVHAKEEVEDGAAILEHVALRLDCVDADADICACWLDLTRILRQAGHWLQKKASTGR